MPLNDATETILIVSSFILFVKYQLTSKRLGQNSGSKTFLSPSICSSILKEECPGKRVCSFTQLSSFSFNVCVTKDSTSSHVQSGDKWDKNKHAIF